MFPTPSRASTSDAIPRQPGTYMLVFRVEEEMTVQVGKLGELVLTPGVYVYVGSAHGPGGLGARIERHLRRDKRPHWHIDHVTKHIAPTDVLYITDREKWECAWVQALLRRPGTTVPLKGMGNGDCTAGCPAHFLRLDTDVMREDKGA